MEPLLLTPKEAAKALGLSQSYIYELLASEALPSITIGRTRRIPRRALEDFVEARAAEQVSYHPHHAVYRRTEEATP
jgi:excisionase family DNA binding protein